MEFRSMIKGRRRARNLALQALYQWLMSDADTYAIEMQFSVANDMTKVDIEYFQLLLYGVVQHVTAIEAALLPWLDRPLISLNPIELTTLRIGAFELLYCPEIPYRIVLDTSVLLAKEFGSQDGYRYVNGVLNNLAKQFRLIEQSSG